jgi:hypothetical protein
VPGVSVAVFIRDQRGQLVIALILASPPLRGWHRHGSLLLPEGAGEAVQDGRDQIVRERALAGLDEDLGRHAGVE